MSSQDADPPRKTLSLKPRAAASGADKPEAGERKRSGARARQVAQQERLTQQRQPAEPASPPPAERSRDAAPRRGSAAGQGKTVDHRSGSGQRHQEQRSTRDRHSYASRDRRDEPGERGSYERGAPERDSVERDWAEHGAAERGPADRGPADRGPANRVDERRSTRERNHDDSPARGRHDEREFAGDRHDARTAPRPYGSAGHRDDEIFPVFASCPQGMEEALAIEMQALGFDDARIDRAGVRLHTDWDGVQRANLYSRLATRVLVELSHGPVSHEDDIFELAYDTPWERWFGAEHSLRVDTSAIRSPMKSLQFCNLRAKDGICDRLRDREGARPSIDTVRPDARVHLFLSADSATLYLDTSGESLFKRGWRLEKGEAPLRENLAAGLLALAGWDPAEPLMDPFCGSGTLLIEAAWIALGVPPGISRPLGFERLRDHDARAWELVREEARSRILPRLDAPLLGVDIDRNAIEAAGRNAERAWLSQDSIRFEVGDAREVAPPAPTGWIVTNPPYGERLEAGDDEFWQEWASNLKRHYAGWHLNVITSDLRFPQALRLKAHRRIPVHNGALDCRLFAFDLVEGGNRHKSGA